MRSIWPLLAQFVHNYLGYWAMANAAIFDVFFVTVFGYYFVGLMADEWKMPFLVYFWIILIWLKI
jgi:hypothetical protein